LKHKKVQTQSVRRATCARAGVKGSPGVMQKWNFLAITSAANLRFLSFLAACSFRNLKFKSRTRIIKLLVPLCFRSSYWKSRQWMTNFGSGALVCACLASATPSHALSLQDKLSAWVDASDAERQRVSRVLTLVASGGLSHFNEEFFESCIDFASSQ